ncbi:hypothetical protein [Frankia sp. BMG5.23]|uniref:hypothetical protein n=1 Tax=Frankia sp. BMG5.23 TaxID=683305 RepID=UPI00046174A4|nr:hypothetical protein [Frankia sp. BMG5.23]KDA41060.1 hypothetical protein BMG523Draft_04106 [Frankia sp. BMG5.23]
MPSVPENPSADPVPLTVWTTRAGDGEHLPGDILRRILDTYSRPGELVITTTDILTGIADMCTATGRRHRTVNTSSDTDIPGWILTSRVAVQLS